MLSILHNEFTRMLRYRLAMLVFAVSLFLAAIVNSTPTPPHRLTVRDGTTVKLSGRKSGVIFKGDQQTTCGLVLLASQAALVAADCFDLNGKNVDRSITYRIYTTPAHNKYSAGFDIKNIVIHPDYNPESKANNIAAVSYNVDGSSDWEMDNAIDFGTWDKLIYNQRHLKSIEGMVWSPPDYTAEDTIENDATCSDLSPIYGENADKFACTTILTTPRMDNSTACKIPHPLLFAQMGDEVYQAGIFSHSVVKGGDSLCENNEVRSYYTLIGNYLAFAEKALNQKFPYHGNDDSSTPQSDPNYSMKSAPKRMAEGTAMLSGDFYHPREAVFESDLPSESTSTSTSTGADKEAEDSTDGELDSDESKDSDLSKDSDVSKDSDKSDISDKAEASNALDSQNDSSDTKDSSKRTIIIAAVCGSVGTLILLASILLGIRWYRGHVSKVNDPYQAPSAHDQLEEIFETPDGSCPPPAYKLPGETSSEQGRNHNATNRASSVDSQYSEFNFPQEKS